MVLLSAVLALIAAAVRAETFGGRLQYEALAYDPTPDPKAVVVCGNARFTVLSGALIRMQYFNSSTAASSVDGDAATLAFVNRKTTVPQFSVDSSGAACNITTADVKLQYLGGNFSASTLSVSSLNSSSAFEHWDASMRSSADPGNLLGTFRTLDGTSNVTLNCTSNGKQHCVFGIVSRSGWSLVDDSGNAVLEDQHDWPFSSSGDLFARNDTLDWYLFAHGHDYKRAIADFTAVSGRPALLPRAALGVWFTRWFDYENAGARAIVDEGYAGHGLPLSVLVLDMNWHKKNGWTGYTFDPALYPDPADLGDFTRQQRGLTTLVNLHDASGVGSWEDQYQAYCSALGQSCDGSTVAADFVHRSAMVALEDVVWQPVQQQFADYAWIDWQQGENGGNMPGGFANPTLQLNKVRNTDPKRRAATATAAAAAGALAAGAGSNTSASTALKRGMQLGRFGGLGNQRYPVGFSGDVAGLSWQNLAYQPYFTMTSSNVAFGLWSHDIVGNPDDHELYVRWVQWGSLSPIMRSHDRGMSAGGCYNPFPDFGAFTDRCGTVMPWDTQPYYFGALKKTLLRRSALVPYLYTASSDAFATGLPLMRPLYYDWPESDMAYAADSIGTFTGYMLGDSLLVSPIVAPGANTTLASHQTWLPPGEWVELETHRLLKGGRTFVRDYAIDQVPIFARAGAVVPYRSLQAGDTVGTAGRVYAQLGFWVFPGAASGSGKAYEDDGRTTAYQSGDSGEVTCSYTWAADSSSLSLSLASSNGFSGEPASRLVTVRVVNAPQATEAVQWTVNGQQQTPLQFQRWGGAGSWSFDGHETSLVIELPALTPAQLGAGVDVTVQLDTSTGVVDALNAGAKGMMANSRLGKAALDRTRVTPGAHSPDPAYLSHVASTGDVLSSLAGSSTTAAEWATLVTNLSATTQAALQEISGDMPPPPPPPGALVQLFDGDRNDHVLCGTAACVGSNEQYDQVRIEGYQPSSSAHSAVKLNDYWSQDANDNWASTASSTPAGYSNAVFSNGYVLSEQQDGTAPLYCYYNSALKDHMAVATAAGIKEAQDAHYALCDGFPGGVMGYVLTQPTQHDAAEADALGEQRRVGHIGDALRAGFVTGLLRSAMQD